MERLRRALRGADRGETPALPVGEAMHPITLLAVILLVVNDWILKPWLHDALTGKLSDVAGLIFAPVVLSAAIGLVLRLFRRDGYLTQRRLVVCIAATGVTSAAVKLSADVGHALARVIGHHAAFYPDRTDLLCLPALLVAYWIGRDEIGRLTNRR